jgi:hypothetical protein
MQMLLIFQLLVAERLLRLEELFLKNMPVNSGIG